MAALALVAAAVVVLDPFREQDEPGAGRPWFYRIAPEEIESIEILHGEGHVRFLRVSESAFVFVRSTRPTSGPGPLQWSPLLVSGPRAKRELPLDSAASGLSDQYGLDDPRTVVRVGVAGKEDLEFRLGRETSDGAHQYGQVSGVAALHLIASSWGEVLARLAEEPPLPKWYVERSPEEIVELNLYRDGPRPDVPPSLRFNKSEGAWTVGRGVGETARPVDAERWSDLLPLLSGARPSPSSPWKPERAVRLYGRPSGHRAEVPQRISAWNALRRQRKMVDRGKDPGRPVLLCNGGRGGPARPRAGRRRRMDGDADASGRRTALRRRSMTW